MFHKCRLFTTVVLSAALLTGILIGGCGSSDYASPLPESTAAEFKQQLDQPGLVLAKFGAPWCPPCREVDRELAKLAAMSDAQATIITINVDEETGLSKEYNISSIPRLMLFQDGSKIKDHLGYADLDEIQSWIRAAAASSARSPKCKRIRWSILEFL